VHDDAQAATAAALRPILHTSAAGAVSQDCSVQDYAVSTQCLHGVEYITQHAAVAARAVHVCETTAESLGQKLDVCMCTSGLQAVLSNEHSGSC
jgi:hypothetical protein